MTSPRWWMLVLALGFGPQASAEDDAPPIRLAPLIVDPDVTPAGGLKPANDAGVGRSAASIVGRVDNEVILLEDVIAPVRSQLLAAKKQLPEDQYLKYEWELLKQSTKARVQRVVVLKELQKKLPNEKAMASIRERAGADFDKYLDSIARETKAKSRAEVVEQLRKEGSTLESLRKEFVDNLLAQQFVNEMVRSQQPEPSRSELLEYYRKHQDEFRQAGGAVWRQIEIKFEGDKEAAYRKATSVLKQLKSGVDFGELAKQYSEGPTAFDGGLWPVTSKGSFAVKEVDRAIFSLPIGQVSDLIETKSSLHIIRVDERADAGVKPFIDVQEDIRKAIKLEALTNLRRAKIEEVVAKHYVETIFDDKK